MSKLEIGKLYRFSTYATGVLPSTIENVRVTDVVSGRTAEMLGHNVATKHAQVYAHLPGTLPVTTDYTSQNYYLVTYENGSTEAYGEYWIDAGTVVELSTRDMVVHLKKVNPEQVEGLLEVLAANGFTVDKTRSVL